MVNRGFSNQSFKIKKKKNKLQDHIFNSRKYASERKIKLYPSQNIMFLIFCEGLKQDELI